MKLLVKEIVMVIDGTQYTISIEAWDVEDGEREYTWSIYSIDMYGSVWCPFTEDLDCSYLDAIMGDVILNWDL